MYFVFAFNFNSNGRDLHYFRSLQERFTRARGKSHSGSNGKSRVFQIRELYKLLRKHYRGCCKIISKGKRIGSRWNSWTSYYEQNERFGIAESCCFKKLKQQKTRRIS